MDEHEFRRMIQRGAEKAGLRGLTLSQAYFQLAKERYKKLEKTAPSLWKAVMSRKYLLPTYRQNDYVNQELCSYLMLDHIVAAGRGKVAQPEMTDEVMRTHYLSFLRQIECDRPTYFLERELAPAMVKTPLPDDFMVSDINWRWSCFRVYLPHGTLTIERDGKINNMIYLDIMSIKANESYTLADHLKRELWSVGAYLNPSYKNDLDGITISGIIGLDDPMSGLGFTGSTPIDGMTIKRIRETKGTELNKEFPSDEIDSAFIHKMLMLGLNLLIFMSSYPSEYDTDAGKGVVRPPKKEGERTVPGLYHAKFVGAAQLRARYVRHAAGASTGYQQMAQWRSGHWKRIWYGPKKGQNRLQWIGMYHTGTEEEAGPKPKNKPV